MEYNQESKTLIIFNKRRKLETVINSLVNLSSKQIEGFFMPRGIQFPRKIHYLAMVKVLNERIKKINSLSLSKDGFEKLCHYPNFTEYQLMNLFGKICTQNDYLEYRKTIWELLFLNYATINLSDGEVQYLINLKKQGAEDFATYSTNLSRIGLDLKDEFDGCSKNILPDAFRYVYTNEDIANMAKTYGITVNQHLKKEELLACVKALMKKRKKLTNALSKELDEMTIGQLNSFCEVHKLCVSSNLRKDELVYYFLYLLDNIEISTLNIKRILGTNEITPLAFTVDLDVVQPFGRGPAKKIIYFDTDEDGFIDEVEEPMNNEIPPMEEENIEEIVEEIKEEIEEKTVVEEVKEVAEYEKYEAPVEVNPFVDDESQEEVIEEEIKEEVQEEIKDEEVKEETMDIPVDVKVEEEIETPLPEVNLVSNPLFENEKPKKKVGKKIFITFIILLVICALIFASLYSQKYL